MQGVFVTYFRVSTERQGRSGLGLDAQRAAVASFLNGGDWRIAGEFVEIESGAKNNRPKLDQALNLCSLVGATLLIAKLDRLSRDAHFLLGLQKAGVKFVAADMPEASEMTVGILAVVAQNERKMISKRTKEALAVAKARGTVLGGRRANSATLHETGVAASIAARNATADAFAAKVAMLIRPMQAEGHSLRKIAETLNATSVKTARPGGTWTSVQVARVLERAPEPVAIEPKPRPSKGMPLKVNRRSPENITKDAPP